MWCGRILNCKITYQNPAGVNIEFLASSGWQVGHRTNDSTVIGDPSCTNHFLILESGEIGDDDFHEFNFLHFPRESGDFFKCYTKFIIILDDAIIEVDLDLLSCQRIEDLPFVVLQLF